MNVRKLLCLVLALCVCAGLMAFSASAAEIASGTCGENLTWSLDEDGTLTISGTGAMDNYDFVAGTPLAPWYGRRNEITTVVIEEGVTTIGDAAFVECVAIGSVQIPEGVTYVGREAFHLCCGLESVALPDSVTEIGRGAFSYCSGMNQINIPAGVAEIKSFTFNECGSLASITIPAGVRRIEAYAFSMCLGLTEIYFEGDAPEFTVSVEDDVFPAFDRVTATAYYPANNATWTQEVMDLAGSGLTWVPYTPSLPCADGNHVPVRVDPVSDRYYVCQYCGIPCFENNENVFWALEEDGTLLIYGEGSLDFYGKTWDNYKDQITRVIVKEGITGDLLSFDSCENLTSVSLPEGITRIYGFAGCTKLETINFPGSLTTIDSNAFQGCASLTEVHLPASLQSFGARPFGGCTRLTGIWVDENNPWFTNDEFGAIYSKDMTYLEEVPGGYVGHFDVPETVTDIDWAAFDGCTQMTGIDLTCAAKRIYMETFNNCTGLTEITIPGNIDFLEINTFRGCTNLATIIFEGDPPAMNSAFNGITATAYYPADNATWTEEAMRDCGGDITWVGRINYLATGTCGENLTWALEEDGTLTISGSGAMWNYGESDDNQTDILTAAADWRWPVDKVISVVMEPGITSIGEKAFFGCSDLSQVSIPNTVTSIGFGAFGHMRALTSIRIPDSVTHIGRTAFGFCMGLKEVYIGKSITSIGDYAFSGCADGIQVYISGAEPTFGEDVFLYVSDWEVHYLPADGWAKENGAWIYYKDGEKVTGWLKDGSSWYYMDGSGYMYTGWLQEGGKWYYLGSSGAMVSSSWTKVGGYWYYMNKDGSMATGWTKIGNNWYFMNQNGVMMTGWVQSGGKWYYMSKGGAMQTGWVAAGGKWYFMNSSGVMVTGWVGSGGKWYYMGSSGAMTVSSWVKDGGYWYYMDANGVMVTGQQTINGKTYFFNDKGVWIP